MGDDLMANSIYVNNTLLNAELFTMPAERTFREGWEANTETQVISVNMTLAKEIWRNKIRDARKAELEKLDTAYLRAMETGADTTQIIADKQALRDAPAHSGIDAATTPEELKAVQPIPNVTVT